MRGVHARANGDERAGDIIQADRAALIAQLWAGMEARQGIDDFPLPLPLAHAVPLALRVAALLLDSAARAGCRRGRGETGSDALKRRAVSSFAVFCVRLTDKHPQQAPQEEDARHRGDPDRHGLAHIPCSFRTPLPLLCHTSPGLAPFRTASSQYVARRTKEQCNTARRSVV